MILKCFIDKSVIDKYSLGQIDVSNPHNFMKVEEIYIGAKANNLIKISNVTELEVKNLKLRILEFYICLATEIKNRFDFDSNIYNFLSLFQPHVAKSGNINSIIEAELYFPDLVTDVETLDMEWRLLSENLQLKNEELNFWLVVGELKVENQLIFPNLIKLVKGILALPHSSAAAERVFSQLSLIKTRTRNKLYIETCDALLSTKELLRNTNCIEWSPNDALLSIKWNKCISLDTICEEVDLLDL